MFSNSSRMLRMQVRRLSNEPPAMAQVRQALKDAMRSGDATSKNTLRAVMAAVKNANIDKPDSVVSDVGFYQLLASQISSRQKSIEDYIQGKREDLAEKEQSEITILEALKNKLEVASDEEIDAKVKEFLSSLELPEGKAKLGKAMSALKPRWAEIESTWKAPQKSVVESVKRALGIRQFSTSARASSHENPLGIPRRSRTQPVNNQRRAIPGVKHVILVSSAKGGVGKSTVAVNLALALYDTGYSSGILDVDIFGPSIPTMLDLKGEPRITKNGHLEPLVNYGIKAMSMGFLVPPERAVSWRGLLVQKALQQLLFEVDWGHLDYLVIDMPPGTGDVQLTLAQQLKVAGAVVVSTPQDIALIDAVRGIDMFRTVKIPILGMVENMSVFVCPNCHSESHIFGHDGAVQEAHRQGIPVLASIPLSIDIARGSNKGLPVVFDEKSAGAKAYRELANKVVAAVDAESSKPDAGA